MGRAEFSASVTVSNANTLGGSGVYNRIAVGVASTVECKVGSVALSSRSNIFIQSDPANTDKIYLGLDNTVTNTKYFAVLSAGQSWSMELDPQKTLKIWAYSPTVTQYIGVLEVAD